MHEPYVKPPLTLFDLSSQHRRFRVATRSEFSQAHGSRLAVPAKGPGSRVCRDDPHPSRQTQIELQVVLEGVWQCNCDGEKEGPMQRSYRMADKSVIWTGERYSTCFSIVSASQALNRAAVGRGEYTTCNVLDVSKSFAAAEAKCLQDPERSKESPSALRMVQKWFASDEETWLVLSPHEAGVEANLLLSIAKSAPYPIGRVSLPEVSEPPHTVQRLPSSPANPALAIARSLSLLLLSHHTTSRRPRGPYTLSSRHGAEVCRDNTFAGFESFVFCLSLWPRAFSCCTSERRSPSHAESAFHIEPLVPDPALGYDSETWILSLPCWGPHPFHADIGFARVDYTHSFHIIDAGFDRGTRGIGRWAVKGSHRTG